MGEHKIINDPVHGTIRISGPLLDLASTPEVNRLNQIRQLGLAYLVFPGAQHTRFEHSMGVSHVAGLLGRALGIDKEEISLIQTAGLLHDLGHGPFSHTMERIFYERIGKEHMALTKDIITGNVENWGGGSWKLDEIGRGKNIPDIIRKYGMEPEAVAALVCQEGSSPLPGQELLSVQDEQTFFSNKHYLYQIIHSALDADQLDFLLRDSHYTGVAYGIIDLDRIVNTSTLFHGEFMVEKRGISSLEGMLVARSLMYSSVYFHKTARIAESMLCRAGDHLSDEELMMIWGMADTEALHYMGKKDGIVGNLAARLRFRRLYKCAYRIGSEEVSEDIEGRIKELSAQRERSHLEREIERKLSMTEGSVIIDVPDPSLTLSEPRLRRTDIKVLGDRPEILSRISSLARALQHRPPLNWCLMVSCPEEYREKVAVLAQRVILSD
ncbi:MAG: HD domain-containing protein [Candidatus Thermoplasmatota archaeon]|nr:HD domain-containing protein [Candidatus Thermoplasmatota archaeon]